KSCQLPIPTTTNSPGNITPTQVASSNPGPCGTPLRHRREPTSAAAPANPAVNTDASTNANIQVGHPAAAVNIPRLPESLTSPAPSESGAIPCTSAWIARVIPLPIKAAPNSGGPGPLIAAAPTAAPARAYAGRVSTSGNRWYSRSAQASGTANAVAAKGTGIHQPGSAPTRPNPHTMPHSAPVAATHHPTGTAAARRARAKARPATPPMTAPRQISRRPSPMSASLREPPHPAKPFGERAVPLGHQQP